MNHPAQVANAFRKATRAGNPRVSHMMMCDAYLLSLLLCSSPAEETDMRVLAATSILKVDVPVLNPLQAE